MLEGIKVSQLSGLTKLTVDKQVRSAPNCDMGAVHRATPLRAIKRTSLVCTIHLTIRPGSPQASRV